MNLLFLFVFEDYEETGDYAGDPIEAVAYFSTKPGLIPTQSLPQAGRERKTPGPGSSATSQRQGTIAPGVRSVIPFVPGLDPALKAVPYALNPKQLHFSLSMDTGPERVHHEISTTCSGRRIPAGSAMPALVHFMAPSGYPCILW